MAAIFLGGPEAADSRRRVHERLDYALDILGGLQQPDHPTSEEHARQCEQDRRDLQVDLRATAAEILDALGVDPHELL